jgi:hypothetical protein
MMGRPQADRDTRTAASVRCRRCRRRRLARRGGPPITEDGKRARASLAWGRGKRDSGGEKD